MAFIILILAVVIRTSMVESPFVLNKLDAYPRYINASAQDINQRAKNLGKAKTFWTQQTQTVKHVDK